jgi:hypothetical protein
MSDENDTAATILFASRQGFAKVLIVGEMPNGETKIVHSTTLEEILATLDLARRNLDDMLERTRFSRPPP